MTESSPRAVPWCSLLSWLALLCAGRACAEATLIEHVHGYTLAAQQLRQFDAMAFEDGKVLRTGSAVTLGKAYPHAIRVDGGGRTLLPGLIDAHGHVLMLGFTFVRIQLFGTHTLAEAQQRIRAYTKQHPESAWYLGDGWNQVIWRLGRFPSAADLDAVIADRPAALGRVDGHALWLNSAALRAAGITRDTPDPTGGRIERDANGNPSGVLVDNAMRLMNGVMPPVDDAERLRALRAAIADLNSVGLTSVGDAGEPADVIALYRQLADAGELTVRVYAMILDAGDDFRALSKAGPLIDYAQGRLTVRAVKLFADGALGSRGAALLAPYSDKPDQSGLLRMSAAEMESKIQDGLAAGYQVNVHAIGDAANRQVLDGFEAAYKAVGGRELRNRIEHAQVVALSDIPRFRQLDLIASMQPTHATSDINMAQDRIGPERLKGAYAWRSFLDQGTRIAGGSDFPVESDNPFFGLHAAVTRTDHEGNPPGGWHPEQAMTRLEAFRAFTLDAAYAQHQENEIGSLEPGKWADFILVDRDLFTVPAADIWKIKVEQTWLAGQRVFQRP
ncbi:MAG: amidohydrolase [Steroidobacteraceae bacterium]